MTQPCGGDCTTTCDALGCHRHSEISRGDAGVQEIEALRGSASKLVDRGDDDQPR